MTLVAPDRGEPELSVVIVTHGAWKLTERALAGLEANTDATYELIVVDNASPDETPDRLAELGDARVIVNETNLGFGPAVNRGARQARADRLLLLNTDAFVHPGWLRPLREALDDPGIGAAIPRLLHCDGTLQEAGTLLARDARVLVYGDGDDPECPWYGFRRLVDYGSAACMLIRRDLFNDLGGFDEAYAPAYYEDADLCLRLAQRGYGVIYEPRSTVTHVRYGSGTPESAVALSERNRQLFAQRWNRRLIGRPSTFSGPNAAAAIAARDALANPRLLMCANRGNKNARALALIVQDLWHRARVTLADGASPADFPGPDPALAAAIEIVESDDPSWLDDRLFHYDALVIAAGTAPALRDRAKLTQPQAVGVTLEELAGRDAAMTSRVLEVMGTAGIPPPAAARVSR